MFWFNFLKIPTLKKGDSIKILSSEYIFKNGILRQKNKPSRRQEQTKETFAYKWNKLKTYRNDLFQKNTKDWLLKRYFNGKSSELTKLLPKNTKLLDAGCGAGVPAILLFKPHLNRIDYLGVDISESIDLAKKTFAKYKLKGEFLQCDLANLPFTHPAFDLIFSEGALHHCDSTEKTFKYLAKLLLPKGRFIFYIYRKKAAAREFSDDHIRSYLSGLSDRQAWNELKSLTRLGKILGDLNIDITIPEKISCLGIPKGRVNLQRLFYWYFCKMFYKPDYSLEEMNHINFDWYRPLNCHRHTPEEVKKWCKESRLRIERLHIEESGITGIAKKEE